MEYDGSGECAISLDINFVQGFPLFSSKFVSVDNCHASCTS